jgi:hypothetical protein
LVIFKISKLDKNESDLSVLNTIKEKQTLNRGFFLSFIDYIYIYSLSLLSNLNDSKVTSLVDNKISQLDNNNFYKFNNNTSVFSTQQLFLYGLKSV